MKPKLIAFLNSYTEGVSGGDIRFIEIAKRTNNFDKIVITSLLGKKLCAKKGLKARYFITTDERYIKSILLTYFERIIRALLLKVNVNRNDILYSTSDFLPDIFPAFRLKRKNNVKWVALIHHIIRPPLERKGDFFGNFLSFFAQKLSFILIKRYSDLVLTVNDNTKQHLIQLGFSRNRTFVIGNGINYKQIRLIQAPREVVYDACFVARLHPTKGIFDLIQIWNYIVNEKGDAKLAIMGRGSREITKYLEDAIRKARLKKNVYLLGFVSDTKLFHVMKSSKIFIFPSYEEGWSISICEAMACGLPVVAYDLPVYRGTYPKGIVRIPLKNIDKFAKWVLELLGNKELYNKLSKEATEIAKKHDWNEIAIRELETIQKVLQK